ncbi:MAG TPA: GGDEF domain-containing protein [Casimicrobiaceae bacterium]
MPIAVLRQFDAAPTGAWHRIRTSGLAAAAAVLLAVAALPIAGAQSVESRDVEATLAGDPDGALDALRQLAARDDEIRPAERRHRLGLEGQALIQTGRVGEAQALARRIDAEAQARKDPLLGAVAMLIQSGTQWRAGDAATAQELALGARTTLQNSGDLFLEHWAALAAATASRARGQFEQALDNLHAALAAADLANDSNRRAAAHYQMSVLTLALKQPPRALGESREAFRQAAMARNAYLMAKAKMAESAAMEVLGHPAEEIAALEDALTIARTTGSATTEALALVNLADIYLRRKDFKTAYELARAALDIARPFDDISLMATAKANMGFALLASGRIDAGKRLADEAVADYERAGAAAETASLLGEYAQYLEGAGDFKAALALVHRERALYDLISSAAHNRAVLELQSRYEGERRRLEIERLNQENTMKSAELRERQLTERVLWLFAAGLAAMFTVVVVLYRKLRVTNTLLGQKNQALQSLSGIDPLTSLFNRRHFQDFIDAEPLAGDRRRQGMGAEVQGVLLIDLDHFKSINDRHGHAAGDVVLVAMSERLRLALREEDMIVRWGGEEFLVFVPAVSIGRLDDIARRIMDTISSQPVMHRGAVLRVTASIGYAPMPLPPHDFPLTWERALALVDKALYMAKLHGRNRAYGVGALHAQEPEALDAALGDLEAAWKDGVVDMRVLINGPRPVSTALPPDFDLAA